MPRLRGARDHAPAGRVRIAWGDDATLKVDTEAGTQTRRFNSPGPSRRLRPAGRGRRSPAGSSPADVGAVRRAADRSVVTQNLRAGYLRKNGVPHSADTQVTEFYNVVTDATSSDTWLFVTTMVEDLM